jgi:hypothetical protein
MNHAMLCCTPFACAGPRCSVVVMARPFTESWQLTVVEIVHQARRFGATEVAGLDELESTYAVLECVAVAVEARQDSAQIQVRASRIIRLCTHRL